MSIEEKLKEILSERIDVSNLKEDDKLTDLGLDSLDLVEVMLKIEEELNIEFTSDEIAGLVTLKNVVNLIQSKVK